MTRCWPQCAIWSCHEPHSGPNPDTDRAVTQRPVFLERHRYRRRRAADAVRLLPVVGALLFLAPLIWSASDRAPLSTAWGGVYIFAAWSLLIFGAFVLGRFLGRPATASRRTADEDTPQRDSTAEAAAPAQTQASAPPEQ